MLKNALVCDLPSPKKRQCDFAILMGVYFHETLRDFTKNKTIAKISLFTVNMALMSHDVHKLILVWGNKKNLKYFRQIV